MTDLTTTIKHFATLNRAPGPTWTDPTNASAAQVAPVVGGAGPGSPWFHHFAVHRRHQRSGGAERAVQLYCGGSSPAAKPAASPDSMRYVHDHDR
ncbi:hypothetical protein [Pelotalea chapellei]|uniref:hypothetical protein n=1 Tax=Pelotalea chapellei TaxID=44671 RepID=UPI001FEC6ABE|nr:hypothetical protein [Pelotalea chapellei]